MSIDKMRLDRAYNSNLIKAIVAALSDEIAIMLDTRTRTCCNCMYFTQIEECAKVKPPQRPPANIIVKGCELWAEDDIPF